MTTTNYYYHHYYCYCYCDYYHQLLLLTIYYYHLLNVLSGYAQDIESDPQGEMCSGLFGCQVGLQVTYMALSRLFGSH